MIEVSVTCLLQCSINFDALTFRIILVKKYVKVSDSRVGGNSFCMELLSTKTRSVFRIDNLLEMYVWVRYCCFEYVKVFSLLQKFI